MLGTLLARIRYGFETKVLTDLVGYNSLASYRTERAIMKVKASFFGPIRRPWPEQSREVEVENGSDVQTLLESLGYQSEDLRRVAVVIGGKKVKLSQKLSDGDEVRFVLLAGGG